MAAALPEIKHVYQNHHLDSTRWQHYIPRDDDIIIATPYKSGTTWMQTIVTHLVFQDLQVRPVMELSPWVDMRVSPIEEVMHTLESQTHRRVIKTHLPLDGMRYSPQVKYVVVGRDARDVFMSLWNHYRIYTPATYEHVNETPGRVGVPFPTCPEDIREFWRGWMTRGWFEWESEGYPFWSNLRHVQTWWDFKHLPNILLVHFNDLLDNLAVELRRIADYLAIYVSEAMLAQIANAVTFSTMKQNADKIIPSISFKGGARAFLYKGTNGRWREALTDGDLALYDSAVIRELTPDCAQWLAQGRGG
jgi:aryl sulfotransferase